MNPPDPRLLPSREPLEVAIPRELAAKVRRFASLNKTPLSECVEGLLAKGLEGVPGLGEDPSPLDLERVTLLLFNGKDPEQGARVLRFVTSRIRFGRVVHLATARPQTACPGDYFQIPRLDYRQAMRFQARCLGRYVDTPFVIQIECDGFPVNPHLWTDEFFDWDYIGAPWPPQLAPEGFRVGNGGCSLRSKRFLEALESAPDHLDENGDCYMCQRPDVREHLAAAGIRFAPLDVAMRFAIENVIPEFPDWTDDRSFGFHGFVGRRERVLDGF